MGAAGRGAAGTAAVTAVAAGAGAGLGATGVAERPSHQAPAAITTTAITPRLQAKGARLAVRVATGGMGKSLSTALCTPGTLAFSCSRSASARRRASRM
jgi:hypothetical protein